MPQLSYGIELSYPASKNLSDIVQKKLIFDF